MDIAMFIVTLISMIATVVSSIIAVKAKNESKRILNQLQIINSGKQSFQSSILENSGDIEMENSGDNDGVIAGVVTGGINNNGKK